MVRVVFGLGFKLKISAKRVLQDSWLRIAAQIEPGRLQVPGIGLHPSTRWRRTT